MKLKYFLGNSNDQPDWENPHIISCDSYETQEIHGKKMCVFATEDDLVCEQVSKIKCIVILPQQMLNPVDARTLCDISKDFDEINIG